MCYDSRSYKRKTQLHSFLTFELDISEWSASLPGKQPPAHWAGDSVGPRAPVDAIQYRKISPST